MFPSGVFNAFSSSNGSRQNNDYYYDFNRFLQEERDRYHRNLAHSLAEQERRRREMDMIQKQLYMKEMERRRDDADQQMERRREMEIRQNLQKKQNEEDLFKRTLLDQKVTIPPYHGRTVRGPDGHIYKIMYLPRKEDNTPTIRKVSQKKIHTNPQSAVESMAASKPLENKDTELQSFVFDTDDIDDKAKFVHVNSNNVVERIDANASDASVCQDRSSDDSISTHPGVFDTFMDSKEQYFSHPDTKQETSCIPRVRSTMKKIHPNVSKSTSIHTQDRYLKIIQGVDGKFYRALEEVDPYGKSIKYETMVNKTTDNVTNQDQDAPTPVKHDQVSGTKGSQYLYDEPDANRHHFTDFYHEYPTMDRILRMLFDTAPEKYSQPQRPLPQNRKETSSLSYSRLNEQPLKPSIKTMPTYTSPSVIPVKNLTRVIRGPDGRIYQLKVKPHQDENPSRTESTASHSKDEDVVDARGEPKYHHVRGPDGHLYKVKNVHYHEHYPASPLSEPKDTSDGDKTPKHENREFVEDQHCIDGRIVHPVNQTASDKAVEEKVKKISHHVQDKRKKPSAFTSKDEKVDTTNKCSSFYDTIEEEETFEPPEAVMDHVNEMSSPYEFVEDHNGILHDMNHESLPNLSIVDDVVAVDEDVCVTEEEEMDGNQNPLKYTHMRPPYAGCHGKDDHICDVEDASDSEQEDEFDAEEHNQRPIWGQWLEPANDAELHKTEVLRSHNQ
jgi:hypothetical protein